MHSSNANCLFKFILTCLIVFFFSSYTSAQDRYTLNGRVVDQNGEALVGSTVKIKGTTIRVKANEQGAFEIPVTNRHTAYILVVSNLGYRTVEITWQVGFYGKTIELHPSSKNIETIHVEGATESRKLKEGEFALNAIDAKKLANTSTDLNQILNRSTGVKVREQGGVGSDFEFSVNGLAGNAVKFFLDGIPLDVMGSAMALNNIPINLADRIEVYKGVAPIQLGTDALGGAVNIVSNKLLSNYLDISHSMGSFQTHRSSINAQYVSPRGIVLKGSGFFNYSKNNYLMRNVEIVEGQEFVVKDLRRFHDRYRSLMGQVEVGIVNKNWADALFIGLGHTDYDKEVQTGVRQSIVYGAVTKDGYGNNLSLRYKKDGLLNDKLDVSLYGTYAKDMYRLADTVKRKYYWDGSYIDGNPETGSYRVTNVTRPRYYNRTNINYHVVPNHELSLNYTFDQVTNNTYNELTMDEDDMPGRLGKHIGGLGYQQVIARKWTNTLMAKYYGLAMDKKQYDNVIKDLVATHGFKNYFGYGLASVYKFRPHLGIKASYEHTYRLQDVNEVFGDGFQIMNNLDLEPESSDNANIGVFFGKKTNKHDFFMEAMGYFRLANGFIYANQYDNNMLQYQNLANVSVRGVESEVRYSYDWFHAILNMTYQHALDNTKYIENQVEKGLSATYKNRIPNQPWFFGNMDIGFSRANVFAPDSELQFTWGTHYTHYYYRSWRGFATTASLVTIPKQLVHNAVLSYAMHDNRYNVSLECRNLTDELVYDNFYLQKAGRAFYLKLRYFINQ
ncbi:TonB-dependent receptor [Sphingobacterium sp. SGG-5]|uniref:TonB-dependent receptor n=1 Tax=Sphingobacterium sp. SGG-5 TaxID=2710881 RepID=UPI0013EA47B8|nr:TonB-dependent receptor plug domain-containing protein [Sphingobacterium sp. SGG-5]NGM63360.1 TonB-dependent receptor [Sphingobacterium sp. SGG-5]